MSKMTSTFLQNENETEEIAAKLAGKLEAPAVVFLEGQLGAGKTTFVRGFLRALGHQGRVKSPTFTLVETYEVANNHIAHFDLYRLKNPSELEMMGCRDYFEADSICLVEWASMAGGYLPAPTVLCKLTVPSDGNGRVIEIQWQ